MRQYVIQISAGLFLLLLSLITFFYNFDKIVHGQINDALLELYQAYHFNISTFQLFTPSYPGWHSDIIESFVPYINVMIWKIFKVNQLEMATATWYYIAFILTMFIVYKILLLNRDSFSVKQNNFFKILIFTLLVIFSTSSVVGHVTTTLTRNGISLLWSSLAILGYFQLKKNPKMGLATIVIAFIFGIWTYSSFKAFYAGFFLTWMFFSFKEKRYRGLLQPVAASALCLSLYYLVVYMSGISMETALLRGNYVFGELDLLTYLKRFLATIIMPLHFSNDTDFFFEEVVHRSFDRAILGKLLGVFFVTGLLVTLTEFKNNLWSFALLAWLLGSLFFAFAGPSIKYNYANSIYIFFIAYRGIDFLMQKLCETIAKFKPKSVEIYAGIFLCFVAITSVAEEWHHLFVDIPKNHLYKIDTDSSYGFANAIDRLEDKAANIVFGISYYSIDGTRFLLRHRNFTTVLVCPKYQDQWDKIFRILKTKFRYAKKLTIVSQRDMCPDIFQLLPQCSKYETTEFLGIRYMYYSCPLLPR